MTTGQGGGGVTTTGEQHTAPPEAWHPIAEGYDLYDAPQQVELATNRFDSWGFKGGERFLDVAADGIRGGGPDC